MLSKCCTQYVSIFGKPTSGQRTGKVQSSSQFPRRAVLKNVHTRCKHYVNRELPDVQVGFRKGRRTRDQIANILWIIEKAREVWKNIYLCFIDCTKALDCVDHNKLRKTLKERGIPDHVTHLLRNLYSSQEATFRTLYGTTD